MLRKHWKIVTPIAVVLAIAIGFGVAVSQGVFAPESEPAPVATPDVQPMPIPQPVEVPEETEEEESDTLNIEWLGHMEYDPVWNPPDFGEAFWQVVDPEYGYPEHGGTRYILAHACESKECAGDDVVRLAEGDTFIVQGDTYRVDERFTSMKNEIASEPIWEHVEGRIVIVTCLIETTWQLSDKNEVVIASRVS